MIIFNNFIDDILYLIVVLTKRFKLVHKQLLSLTLNDDNNGIIIGMEKHGLKQVF